MHDSRQRQRVRLGRPVLVNVLVLVTVVLVAAFLIPEPSDDVPAGPAASTVQTDSGD